MTYDRINRSFTPVEFDPAIRYKSITCTYVNLEKFTYREPDNVRFDKGLHFDIHMHNGSVMSVFWDDSILVSAHFELE